jgi:hypothetical protein
MTNLVDVTAPLHRAHLGLQGEACTYTLGDGTQAQLTVFVRGQKPEDMFAAAMQQDVVGVIAITDFAAAFPGRATPQRFDRLQVNGRSYSVESHRSAPMTSPVFFKLQLRGGQQ